MNKYKLTVVALVVFIVAMFNSSALIGLAIGVLARLYSGHIISVIVGATTGVLLVELCKFLSNRGYF